MASTSSFDNPPNQVRRYRRFLVTPYGEHRSHCLKDFHLSYSFLVSHLHLNHRLQVLRKQFSDLSLSEDPLQRELHDSRILRAEDSAKRVRTTQRHRRVVEANTI